MPDTGWVATGSGENELLFIVLLAVHSSKMTPSNTLMYPYISLTQPTKKLSLAGDGS